MPLPCRQPSSLPAPFYQGGEKSLQTTPLDSHNSSRKKYSAYNNDPLPPGYQDNMSTPASSNKGTERGWSGRKDPLPDYDFEPSRPATAAYSNRAFDGRVDEEKGANVRL